jgi:hypothetical protein
MLNSISGDSSNGKVIISLNKLFPRRGKDFQGFQNVVNNVNLDSLTDIINHLHLIGHKKYDAQKLINSFKGPVHMVSLYIL